MKPAIRVGGVPEHFNLPWKLAVADGAFTDANVEFTEFPGGTGAMSAALRNDEIDAALLLTEGAIVDILAGGDNRLVSVYVASPLIWGIHVAAGSDITDAADTRGQRFAISRYGSGSHLIAAVDAAERGFDAAAMDFVIVNNLEGARAALGGGDADVFLWEKHMTQTLVDSGEFRRIGERIVPWPAFVVSVRRDFAKQHRGAIRQTLDTVADYARRLKQFKDAAMVVSNAHGIALQDAEAWLAGVEWSDNHEYPADAIKRAVLALSSQNVIERSTVDRDRLWYDLRD